MLLMHALGQNSGRSKAGIPLSISRDNDPYRMLKQKVRKTSRDITVSSTGITVLEDFVVDKDKMKTTRLFFFDL
jgi:hypothetical protein